MQFLTGLLLGALITGWLCGCLQIGRNNQIPPQNQHYENRYENVDPPAFRNY